MTGTLLEWAIIVFIIVSIGVVVRRNGAANPEGTGTLRSTVNEISGAVSNLSGRVQHLESEVGDLTRDAATAKDIQRIEQLVQERTGLLRAEGAAQRETAERTARSVERIERMLIEKGLGK